MYKIAVCCIPVSSIWIVQAQCSTLTLARLPGASEIPPRLARSGNWDFCWSNLSMI